MIDKPPLKTSNIGACHASDCILWKSATPICDCGGTAWPDSEESIPAKG